MRYLVSGSSVAIQSVDIRNRCECVCVCVACLGFPAGFALEYAHFRIWLCTRTRIHILSHIRTWAHLHGYTYTQTFSSRGEIDWLRTPPDPVSRSTGTASMCGQTAMYMRESGRGESPQTLHPTPYTLHPIPYTAYALTALHLYYGY
jgi:hypothetical protein